MNMLDTDLRLCGLNLQVATIQKQSTDACVPTAHRGSYALPRAPTEGGVTGAPRMSAQWYVLARYDASPGAECQADGAPSRCGCGLIREVAWPFGVRRSRGNLQCWRLNQCADEYEAGMHLGQCAALEAEDRTRRENRSTVTPPISP